MWETTSKGGGAGRARAGLGPRTSGRGGGAERAVVKAQSGVVEDAQVVGEELPDRRKLDASDHLHLRVVVDDHLVSPAMGREQVFATGAQGQAVAPVEKAPPRDA